MHGSGRTNRFPDRGFRINPTSPTVLSNQPQPSFLPKGLGQARDCSPPPCIDATTDPASTREKKSRDQMAKCMHPQLDPFERPRRTTNPNPSRLHRSRSSRYRFTWQYRDDCGSTSHPTSLFPSLPRVRVTRSRSHGTVPLLQHLSTLPEGFDIPGRNLEAKCGNA